MKSRIKIIVAAVLAVMVIIVVLQNTQAVETRILFATISMPRALLLFVTFGIGFITGIVTASHLLQRRTQQREPEAQTPEASQ